MVMVVATVTFGWLPSGAELRPVEWTVGGDGRSRGWGGEGGDLPRGSLPHRVPTVDTARILAGGPRSLETPSQRSGAPNLSQVKRGGPSAGATPRRLTTSPFRPGQIARKVLFTPLRGAPLPSSTALELGPRGSERRRRPPVVHPTPPRARREGATFAHIVGNENDPIGATARGRLATPSERDKMCDLFLF